MKGRLKKIYSKFIAFFKKYGIDAFIALLIFNFPMYAVAFINAEGFRQFAIWWTAIWWGLGPLTPGWLVTILLAVFIRWLRMGAWAGILWGREAFAKLQLQNQLAAYLTSEEIEMILAMAKKVSTEAESELNSFKQILRKKRLQMIDNQWTKEKLEVVNNEENIQTKTKTKKINSAEENAAEDFIV